MKGVSALCDVTEIEMQDMYQMSFKTSMYSRFNNTIELIRSKVDFNYLKTLPTNGIFSTRKRLRLLILSGVEYPPRKPAPSAKANSSSIVAPPVTHKRINLNADALKYVVDIKESKMPRATAIPAAKGNV